MNNGYLAIDTSLGTTVAVCVGGIQRMRSSDDERGHAEILGPLLNEVLAGLNSRELSTVVAGVGPGPFTGLRVGLAAATSFAFGIGRLVYPVVSHDAVALEALLDADPSRRVRVIQDAKRRELFITEYEGIDRHGVPIRTREPHIVARADYTETAHDVWHERVPADMLIRLADAQIVAGLSPEPLQALYLRAPDVKLPGPVKRVSS